MIPCIPCPAPVRHIARAIHRRVLRPIGRRVHHVAHHAPRVISYGCCIAAIGGLGGALVAPPGGLFPPAAAAPAQVASQGWPEMPGWSVANGMIGGPGAITGGGAVSIPVYRKAPAPQFLSTQPNLYAPPRQHLTAVPEPSAALLLVGSIAMLPLVRRRA